MKLLKCLIQFRAHNYIFMHAISKCYFLCTFNVSINAGFYSVGEIIEKNHV